MEFMKLLLHVFVLLPYENLDCIHLRHGWTGNWPRDWLWITYLKKICINLHCSAMLRILINSTITTKFVQTHDDWRQTCDTSRVQIKFPLRVDAIFCFFNKIQIAFTLPANNITRLPSLNHRLHFENNETWMVRALKTVNHKIKIIKFVSPSRPLLSINKEIFFRPWITHSVRLVCPRYLSIYVGINKRINCKRWSVGKLTKWWAAKCVGDSYKWLVGFHFTLINDMTSTKM